MSNRLDPTSKVVVNAGVIDTGDRAKTYIFNEDGPQSFAVIGKSDVENVFDVLEKTNDGRVNWGEANNGDGESRKRLDLFDGDGNVSDDFVALLMEAFEGDDGIAVLDGSLSLASITLTVGGRWSTDHLVFEGDFVTQALKQLGEQGMLSTDMKKALAVSDPSGYAATFGNSHINNGDGKDQIGVYQFDVDADEAYYWSHDTNLDPEVQALFDKVNSFFQDENAVALVQAALAEKFGIADVAGLDYCGDDGNAIVINLDAKGDTVDTVVLHGSEIEAILNAFGDDLPDGLDTGDGQSKSAYYNTDDNAGGQGGVWFGGGVNGVTFDTDGTITLNSVVGNGLTQKEDNPNRAWQDDIDEFVYNVLAFDGQSDVSIVAGGQEGDNYMTVEMSTDGGNTDTLLLEGARVGEAIDHFYQTGLEYDFFA